MVPSPIGSAVVWRRELSSSGSELFTQMAVAPLDNRQLCMCGSNGALVVLHLADPARNKVQMQQYRVDMKGELTQNFKKQYSD